MHKIFVEVENCLLMPSSNGGDCSLPNLALIGALQSLQFDTSEHMVVLWSHIGKEHAKYTAFSVLHEHGFIAFGTAEKTWQVLEYGDIVIDNDPEFLPDHPWRWSSQRFIQSYSNNN